MTPHAAVTGLALLVGTAALGLAACNSGPTVTSPTSTSTTTQPPTGTGGTTTTVGSSATTTTAPATTSTTAAAAAGPGRCTVAELSVKAQGSNGAAGHIGQVLTFTNTSTATCTLFGYPGLLMLDNSGQPIPTHVLRTPSVVVQAETPHTVTLAPNRQASFLLGYADETGFGNNVCPTSVNLEITPPNAYSHLVVPDQISAYGPSLGQCGAINVSPVYPGTGAQP